VSAAVTSTRTARAGGSNQALAAAGLPEMRFHELRHTFGPLAIQRASILQVQNWLGHADIETTQIYLRYRSQAQDAAKLSRSKLPPACARTWPGEAVPRRRWHRRPEPPVSAFPGAAGSRLWASVN
jgi:hypothetical protein